MIVCWLWSLRNGIWILLGRVVWIGLFCDGGGRRDVGGIGDICRWGIIGWGRDWGIGGWIGGWGFLVGIISVSLLSQKEANWTISQIGSSRCFLDGIIE